jgi:hypothetical protein
VSANAEQGLNHWQAQIVRISDSSTIVVDAGVFDVTSSVATVGVDPRTHNEVMLGKIESLLEGRADKDVTSYSIAGRSISKMDINDLVSWRQYYQREVLKEARERNAAAGRQSNATVKVRFI